MKLFVIIILMFVASVYSQKPSGNGGGTPSRGSNLLLPITYKEGSLVGGLLRVKNRRLMLEGDIVIAQKDERSILKIYKIGKDTEDKPKPLRHRIKRNTLRVDDQNRIKENIHHVDKRSAAWNSNRLWRKVGAFYTVPYYFATNYNNNLNFANAVSAIESNSLIRFMDYTNNMNSLPYDHIRVFNYLGYGCWSDLGRRGGEQELSLESGNCNSVPIIIHELMHAVGFFHEQSRSDRQSYIKVKWNNIASGAEPNFYRRSQSLSQNTAYDFDSIMHYKLYDFAMNLGEKTLDPKVPVNENSIGNTDVLSSKDITQLTSIYP